MNSLKQTHLFDASDVDFMSRATLVSLQRVFQSVAAADCKRLGVGTKALSGCGMGWVLSRMKYRFFGMPVLDDCAVFETWTNPPRGCEFVRLLDITDERGNLTVQGVSKWCVLDINTARLVPVGEVPYDRSQPFRTDNAFGSDFKKLVFDGEWTRVFDEVIRLSKIDVNGHLNNTRYFEFVTDCFTLEEAGKFGISEFQMDFRSQVREGQTLSVFSAREGEDEFRFKGEADGTVAFLVLKLPFPNDDYKNNWWKKEYYKSKEGKNKSKEIKTKAKELRMKVRGKNKSKECKNKGMELK